jgi:hypothetical protein
MHDEPMLGQLYVSAECEEDHSVEFSLGFDIDFKSPQHKAPATMRKNL